MRCDNFIKSSENKFRQNIISENFIKRKFEICSIYLLSKYLFFLKISEYFITKFFYRKYIYIFFLWNAISECISLLFIFRFVSQQDKFSKPGIRPVNCFARDRNVIEGKLRQILITKTVRCQCRKSVIITMDFSLPSFPKHYTWLSIIRIVLGIGVTVLPARILPFLLVAETPADRNRDPGRVPGSPWNLSIRPTRSPPSAHWLTASLLPSRRLEYHTVPSPTHLHLRFFPML